jgi:hypothetical protein
MSINDAELWFTQEILLIVSFLCVIYFSSVRKNRGSLRESAGIRV